MKPLPRISTAPPEGQPTRPEADRLARVRYRVYQLLLLVVGLTYLAIGLWGYARGAVRYDPAFYLVVGPALLLLAGLQNRLGRVYPGLERAAHAFVVLVFFYQFTNHLYAHKLAAQPGLLAESLIWAPAIYTLTSLVYHTRRALAYSLTIFAGTLAVGAGHLIYARWRDLDLPPLLALTDFYTASVAMILLLYLVTRTYDDLLATRRMAEQQRREKRKTEASLAAAEGSLQQKVAELERLNASLNRANELKGRFLAVMSHELRTPLQSVLGFSELLDEEAVGPLNERQRRYVADIGASGRHLLSLVDDILDISLIEAGEMRLYLEPLEPRTLVEETLSLLGERLEQKDARLEVVCTATNPLLGDRRRLRQALLNYLTNAVKFTPQGGRIRIAVEDAGPGLRFEVADSGAGIAEEQLPKLFQPFSQLDNSYARSYEGAGLGLALTRRLVELHGGQVWVESRPGQGSRFGFDLPPAVQPSGPGGS